MDSLKVLRKNLYLAARELVADGHKDDTEMVKIKRDAIIGELFEKPHDALTEAQLKRCLTRAQFLKTNKLGDKSSEEKKASFNQLRLLRFFSMKCALRYADWSAAVFAIDGAELSGKALQERVEFLYLGRQKLPMPIVSFMYDNWINRKCNEMLVSAGYKKFAKNENRIVYEYLTFKQAKALINRFMKMAEEIFKRENFNLGFN